MKRKGFTLIELLAVIIILGILMLIAIPKEVLKGASILVNSGDIDVNDPNTTYYIPIDAIDLENGKANSPYGKFDEAYVVVTYDGDNFEYYFVGKDEADMGMSKLTQDNLIDKDKIESNVDAINTSISIDDRDNIIIFNDDLTVKENKAPTDYIYSGGVKYPEGKNKNTVVIGDIVSVVDQEFYVYKRENRNVYLLSKYNLKVGKIALSSASTVRDYSPDEEGYGLQSPETPGVVEGSSRNYGTIAFSGANYWKDITWPGNYFGGGSGYAYDRPYPYVYNENSYLYEHVENYRRYLEQNGMKIKEARLLSTEEAVELGCRVTSTCENAPEWVYSTSYWLGSAELDDSINIILTSGDLNCNAQYVFYYYGVRPVIVI